ncbi:hypothetical protein J6590_027026 [Homalodisca vitripennis]|nr:hypothetical protein J6590_027026 [Homalodisca vitripennis]
MSNTATQTTRLLGERGRNVKYCVRIEELTFCERGKHVYYCCRDNHVFWQREAVTSTIASGSRNSPTERRKHRQHVFWQREAGTSTIASGSRNELSVRGENTSIIAAETNTSSGREGQVRLLLRRRLGIYLLGEGCRDNNVNYLARDEHFAFCRRDKHIKYCSRDKHVSFAGLHRCTITHVKTKRVQFTELVVRLIKNRAGHHIVRWQCYLDSSPISGVVSQLSNSNNIIAPFSII